MFTDLVALFPNLRTEAYHITSLCTIDYNCVAYAFGDQTQRWEPDPHNIYHWPISKRDLKVKTWVLAAESLGFTVCKSDAFEDGFVKVAIYAKKGKATHVARQLPDGMWTSKLGDLEDITHTLIGIVNTRYGEPSTFLKKKLTP